MIVAELRCPKCDSLNVNRTTLGYIGTPREFDWINTATCQDCRMGLAHGGGTTATEDRISRVLPRLLGEIERLRAELRKETP